MNDGGRKTDGDQTYTSLTVYSRRVDYAQPPDALGSYSQRDQARIRAVMDKVAARASPSAS